MRGDYLELTTPGERPRYIPLTKARVQIGRSTTCEIPLAGAYVSRRHARLERGEQKQWRLIDLGSANGTYVNGQRIQVATLNSGDVIGIGTHRLVIYVSTSTTGTGGTTSTDAEIVPSDASSRVIERSGLQPNRLVPVRLLADLHEANRRLAQSTDIPSLLALLARDFCSLLQPRRLAVGREDGAKSEWPIVIDAHGSPADGSDLPHQLVPRVKALEGSMAIKWGTGSDGSTVTIDRHSESMLFPIKAGDRRLGHVYVELPSAGRKASDEAIEFLSLLTRQVGLLWENLELQAIRHANAELNRELSAARQIQLQLFPRQRDIHPRLDIAAENIPALGVSGDYYDFQLVDPNRVLFILADVMGHGLSAALLMAGVQAVFRTGVRAGWDLPHLDLHLHDMVEATGHGETFVTGILGLCDVTHASLSLLAAGHPWPSICCEDTFVERDPQACSLPWGVVVPRSPQPFVVTLPESNWSVVAYTDGIAESLGPGGRSYGAHRLIEFHRRYRDRSADELCEEILSDVLRSSDDSTPQNDDITLLVLRNSSRAQPSLPQTL